MSLWQNANKTAVYGCMLLHEFFSLCYAMSLNVELWMWDWFSRTWPFFFFFLSVNLFYLCLRCGTANLNVQRKRIERRNISQGCRRESGSSRRLIMFWPQCKSISAILLMNWSMIYTVSGARFLPPPLAKCWQLLSVFGRPFVLLWVSWFVLLILNSWSGLAVSW